MSSSTHNDARNHRDQPTYWFAVLEIARERGDFEQAAEANLEREGSIRKTLVKPKGAGRPAEKYELVTDPA